MLGSSFVQKAVQPLWRFVQTVGPCISHFFGAFEKPSSVLLSQRPDVDFAIPYRLLSHLTELALEMKHYYWSLCFFILQICRDPTHLDLVTPGGPSRARVHLFKVESFLFASWRLLLPRGRKAL